MIVNLHQSLEVILGFWNHSDFLNINVNKETMWWVCSWCWSFRNLFLWLLQGEFDAQCQEYQVALLTDIIGQTLVRWGICQNPLWVKAFCLFFCRLDQFLIKLSRWLKNRVWIPCFLISRCLSCMPLNPFCILCYYGTMQVHNILEISDMSSSQEQCYGLSKWLNNS